MVSNLATIAPLPVESDAESGADDIPATKPSSTPGKAEPEDTTMNDDDEEEDDEDDPQM